MAGRLAAGATLSWQRYAIYYTPPAGALADFGAAWLGWDGARGLPCPHPDAPFDIAQITERPRKYGMHATMKPPFRLAPGADAEDLLQATRDFCQSHTGVTLEGLCLTKIGGFLALTPLPDETALKDLAAETVAKLDAFRAPMTDQDLARRRKAHLSPKQEANLIRWGYPYVMDNFRFHITLTGPVPSSLRPLVTQWLRERLDPLVPKPFTVDAMSLCGEDEDGRFHLIERVPLSA